MVVEVSLQVIVVVAMAVVVVAMAVVDMAVEVAVVVDLPGLVSHDTLNSEVCVIFFEKLVVINLVESSPFLNVSIYSWMPFCSYCSWPPLICFMARFEGLIILRVLLQHFGFSSLVFVFIYKNRYFRII